MPESRRRPAHMTPGYDGRCFWGGDGGAFVVLRTSSSGKTLTIEQGVAVLADYYGVDESVIAGQASQQTWRTVLAKECDGGYHEVGCGVEDCERGGWCAEGSGARWADVLGVSNTAARAGSVEAAK